MKKILIITIVTIFITIGNVSAGTDGDNSLSNKNSGETKDCFERVNRGIFAFNQALDGAVFEPLAKGYRKLPVPIRRGTSNALDNLSTLITVPNNVLQGEFKKAGIKGKHFFGYYKKWIPIMIIMIAEPMVFVLAI